VHDWLSYQDEFANYWSTPFAIGVLTNSKTALTSKPLLSHYPRIATHLEPLRKLCKISDNQLSWQQF
jgi:hypothetical protein